MTRFSRSLSYISPNLNELKFIANHLNIPLPKNEPSVVLFAARIAETLAQHVKVVVVTLGEDGILIARRNSAEDKFLIGKNCDFGKKLQFRHYKNRKIDDIVNVSGAGDCFASGLVTAMLNGKSEEVCVSVGFASAEIALKSQKTVPKTFFDKTHHSWSQKASYTTITL